MDPDRAEPHLELAKLLGPEHEPEALAELERAARLDPMDPAAPKLLLEKHGARKEWAKVAELAPLALFIDPYDVKVHLGFARALIELGRRREARGEVEAALACQPNDAERRELGALSGRLR